MKKTIGVFEIENSLTEPIFGVVQIDVAWAERMMFLAWEAEQEGATSLNLSSSYISAEKIQAEQFSSFADAVKQAVNYIVANDVFTVRPDEETFMGYVDFEVFGDCIHFNSSSYEAVGSVETESGYAEVFRGSLEIDVSVAPAAVLDSETVAELREVIKAVESLEATQEQKADLNSLMIELELLLGSLQELAA